MTERRRIWRVIGLALFLPFQNDESEPVKSRENNNDKSRRQVSISSDDSSTRRIQGENQWINLAPTLWHSEAIDFTRTCDRALEPTLAGTIRSRLETHGT